MVGHAIDDLQPRRASNFFIEVPGRRAGLDLVEGIGEPLQNPAVATAARLDTLPKLDLAPQRDEDLAADKKDQRRFDPGL